MEPITLFEIYPYEKQLKINSHNFYVDQSKKRLLSQFENLDNEVEQIAQKFYEESGKFFNPDFDDPSDYAERAYENAQEHVMLLSEMREQTLFSIIAGMYHQWDKTLREWMVKETRHWGGENVKEQIWKVDITKLFDLFDRMGWNIKEKPFFKSLDACRLIVNIYKHGSGNSLTDLRNKYPEYFYDFGKTDFDINNWFDHTSVHIEDSHLDSFSGAILNFWDGLPRRFLNEDCLDPPKWLEKALEQDQR
ncbi:hypothetical protein KTH73_04445 [Acinetobacter courvalinii]|uniref:hypothetical protein n=1 Tax=Acinetobacter courvalinii TaxID=280147 RepID=UPI0021CD4CD3|nr:hypothetical protein [Acinetobacter courvalinii]MCU4389976.1 hypothetical protein [Acinetobacter courvalinii]